MLYCYRHLNLHITKLPYFTKSLSNSELRQRVYMNVSLEQKYKRPSDMLLKLYTLQANIRRVYLCKIYIYIYVGCISASQYTSEVSLQATIRRGVSLQAKSQYTWVDLLKPINVGCISASQYMYVGCISLSHYTTGVSPNYLSLHCNYISIFSIPESKRVDALNYTL